MKNPNLHTPKKRFGQNFLKDNHTVQHILNHLHLEPTDAVVEIGPGLGALTVPLHDNLNHLTVVEIDRDLAKKLSLAFLKSPKLTIHTQDALKFDFAALYQELGSQKKLRVIGNLPYNVSTPLLFHLYSFAHLIHDMHFMVQKEVANRLIATPNQKAYGKLGILSQYHCRVEHLFDVPPEAFFPKPAVDSAFVRLTPHLHLSVRAHNFSLLEEVLRTAFNQRRKTLRNALNSLLSPEEFTQLAIDPNLRPEALSLDEFIRMSNWIHERNQDKP